MQNLPKLPISSSLQAIDDTLSRSNSLLLCAPPGSGKTTLVPLALMDSSWLQGRKILMLEPRRLATRAAARRMASLLGEKIGQRVGYQIRFDRKVSQATRIEVVTEGILTRRLQADPELADVGMIIFDEFHERTLHGDLALALSLDCASGLRDDLRILLMSATLDVAPLASLLGDAPVIQAEGRSFDVSHHYLERESELSMEVQVAAAVAQALQDQTGDILAFLPGVGEIRRTAEKLSERVPASVQIHPLYGDLSREAQDAALFPSADGARRVVLATAIAETSLTIEGITAVVDCGWSRLPAFDPNRGLSRLETVRVSRASADQRAGRAGRLGPGTCYRLWTRAQHQALVEHQLPEVARADLAPLVLELAQWGVTDSAQMQWVDLPPQAHFEQAKALLIKLQALTAEGQITPLGTKMAALPLHPRLAHMLLQASEMGATEMAVNLAALLSERDPLKVRPGEPRPVDIEVRTQLLIDWQCQRPIRQDIHVDRKALQRLVRSVKQLSGLLPKRNSQFTEISPGALLSLAYPDRIAQRRPGKRDPAQYLMASGRGVALPSGDALGNEPYLVIADLDAGDRNGRVFSAAAISLEEIRSLHADGMVKQKVVTWDDRAAQVLAREEDRLGSLVLQHQALLEADTEGQTAALLQGIRKRGFATLPLPEEAQQWLTRLRLLASWDESNDWPDVSEQRLLDTLETWLAPWLMGITRLAQLKSLAWGDILRALLDWEQQQRMEQMVPTHIQVPSGSRKKIQYQEDSDPVLPVKLQEMFGLTETPRICNGRVKLVLHLLSPAQRPIQVTQDLAGFWNCTYSEVKKELKGRYPKHYWPDDPMQAVATARVRPKK